MFIKTTVISKRTDPLTDKHLLKTMRINVDNIVEYSELHAGDIQGLDDDEHLDMLNQKQTGQKKLSSVNIGESVVITIESPEELDTLIRLEEIRENELLNNI